MRNKKFYLLVFIFFLFFSFLLQITNIYYNEQEVKYNRNIINNLSTSNSATINWYRTWGGSNADEGFGVAVDSVDNIYLAGRTRSFGAGNWDMVLVKYDSSGTQLWYRTWGGSNDDYGHGVAVDSSDNVYLAGVTYSFGAGQNDMVLVKYDSSGVQLWNQTWGGSGHDYGNGVAVDSSDNVYLTGSTISDIALVKYDGSGVQQWNRTWGGSDYDAGFGVAVDSSDNIYLAGWTTSFGAGQDDMVLVKYDGSGVQQWNRTWGGSDYDAGFGVAVDSSDNIYLAGWTTSYGVGNGDMVLVKYNSSGVELWSQTWGGSGYDYGYEVAVNSSDNVYLAGYTRSFGAGQNDMVLVKYDGSGVQLWNQTWGGNNHEFCHSVAVDSADGIYLGGTTNSFWLGEDDMVLVKYGTSQRKEGPSIPSFFLLPFLSTIGILTVIYIKKKYID